MREFWTWTWRMLLLSALSVVVLFVLDELGVLEAAGQTASGFIGVGLGLAVLLGAFLWMEWAEYR